MTSTAVAGEPRQIHLVRAGLDRRLPTSSSEILRLVLTFVLILLRRVADTAGLKQSHPSVGFLFWALCPQETCLSILSSERGFEDWSKLTRYDPAEAKNEVLVRRCR